MADDDYLGLGSRLAKAPADALAASAFRFELAAAPILLPGMSLADIAHAIALISAGIIDRDAGSELIAGLIEVHEAGPDAIPLDPAIGDPYNNRDRFLRQRLGDPSGLIHAGRARREAATIAWQLAVRDYIVALGAAVVELAAVVLERAREHRRAIMPDFTYLHHAHPTNLGHYLCGFAYPLCRDLERLRRAFALVNRSPAGSGSVNGTRLPIDRRLLAELLEFDGLVHHTRDAMWAPDMALEPMFCASSVLTTADRLAEELQIWTTAEFGFVELDDAHCRTSVIMPQKKNPYGLAYVRGRAREQVGRLAGLTATNLTPTGQPDNRIFAYAGVPDGLDECRRAVWILAETVRGARFETERMRTAAAAGYAYATDICDVLIGAGLDNRTSHRIVGRAIRDAGGAVIDLDRLRAAAAALDLDELGDVDEAAIDGAREPEGVVASRTGIGGAADAPLTAMLDELDGELAAARQFFSDPARVGFEGRLLDRARRIIEETAP